MSNIARFFLRLLRHKNRFVYAKFTAKNMTAIMSSESNCGIGKSLKAFLKGIPLKLQRMACSGIFEAVFRYFHMNANTRRNLFR